MIRRIIIWVVPVFLLTALLATGQRFSLGKLTVRYQKGEGFVAYNAGGERLFVVYPYDNGPDYPSEGLFRIMEKGRIGFADTTGRVVIPPRFTAVFPFREGRAAFCVGCTTVREGEHRRWQGGKWGFIDRQGRVVVPAVYEKVIRMYSEGKAVVVTAGDTVAIDTVGNVIPVKGNR